MLSELKHVRQIEGEGTRRWFRDSYFDLIVWYDEEGGLIGFQLCYDRLGNERSFLWSKGHGSVHERIDAGETPGHSRMAPVSAAGGSFARDQVARRFLPESGEIDRAIARLVYEAIMGLPSPTLGIPAPSSSISGPAFAQMATESGPDPRNEGDTE